MKLTLKELRCIENALSSMLSGEEGEGDWAPSNKAEDMDRAHAKVCAALDAKEAKKGGK